MFGILRYNKYIQSILKTKTNPEPWLHIIIVGEDDKGVDPRLYSSTVDYAIYIWDTREVIETGTVKLRAVYTMWHKMTQMAHDNYQQLASTVSKKIVDKFNSLNDRRNGNIPL
jgi:hypothetical protein